MRKGLITVMLVALLALTASACQAATLEEIQARGVLRVGSDFVEPMAFEADGVYQGLEVDLATRIAEALGVKLEFLRLDWDTVMKAWEPGYDWKDFDLGLASITITDERASVCAFSDWYFMTGQMIMVLADSPIQRPEDLKDVTVGAMADTSGEVTAREYCSDVVTYPQAEDGYEMLRKGQVQAIIYDGGTLMYMAKKDPAFRVLDQKLSRERYGIVMPQGADRLLEAVNTVVKEERKPLFKKWFK